MSTAEKLKADANKCVSEKRYHKAIYLYGKSLEEHKDPWVLSNRALCYLKLDDNLLALRDCDEAVLLLENSPETPDRTAKTVKLLYKRGMALQNLGLHEHALRDFLAAKNHSAPDKLLEAAIAQSKGKLNKAIVGLNALEKGEDFVHDEELIEYSISSPTTNVVTPPPVLPLRIPDPPSTFSHFLNHFDVLKTRSDMFAEYFLNIPVDRYPQLFGDLLEKDHLYCLFDGMITLLERGWTDKVTSSLLFLHEIGRFDLLFCFFSVEEKKRASYLFSLLPSEHAALLSDWLS